MTLNVLEMKNTRKIKKVVNKIPIDKAEEADDIFWAKTDFKFRIEELARLRNFYKRFLGMNPEAKIQLTLNKIPISAQDV